MIDCAELEESLKTAKLGSMSDVIHFIVDHLYKILNFDPIQELQMRVAELERPKGLDRVMLEEVKTLIQAIFQQKEDQFRRDIEKTVHSGIQGALEQDNTRRSMRDLDFLEMINSAQQSKKQSFSRTEQKPPRPPHLKNNFDQIQSIQSPLFRNFNQQNTETMNMNKSQKDQHQAVLKQIAEIRSLLSKKADKKELSEILVDIRRELSNKMPVEQTERIVQKFEKQVFHKMNDSLLVIQRMEYTMKKSVLEETSAMKKQLLESLGCTNCLKGKQHGSDRKNDKKIEKKLLKYETLLHNSTKSNAQEICSIRTEMKQSFEEVFSFIESLNKQEPATTTPVSPPPSISYMPLTATWLAQQQFNIKNMALLWQKQIENTEQQMFMFQANKSQIMLVAPGYYIIQCSVFGCQNPPSLYMNSQNLICRLEQRLRAPLKQRGNNSRAYGCDEMIHFVSGQSRGNTLSIKLEPNDSYSSSILRVTKIG